MAWTINENVWIERNADGYARLISHLLYPFPQPLDGADPYLLTIAYLGVVRDLLGITEEQIDNLAKTIPPSGGSGNSAPRGLRGPQLRWRQRIEIRGGETVVLIIQQTNSVAERRADVEGAGLRVVAQRTSESETFRITGATSTLRHKFNFARIGPDDIDEALQKDWPPQEGEKIRLSFGTTNQILSSFGFGQFPTGAEEAFLLGAPLIHQSHLSLDKSAAPRDVSEAGDPTDYLAVAVRVIPPQGDAAADQDLPPYELVASASKGLPPLAARALLTNMASGLGMVFLVDPITASGDFDLRPNAPDALLNPQRQLKALVNLNAPIAGASWSLSGTHVQIDGQQANPPYPCGGIGYQPPTANAPNFAFNARTNEFAAVNAYYHCDTMFQMLDDFGLPFTGFPAGYQLPARVIHRASIQPGSGSDGNTINAQLRIIPSLLIPPPMSGCIAGQTRNPQVQFRFALADLQLDPGTLLKSLAPLGIACDVRIVWHEFCHALIAAATDQVEFPFAHSAGDSLAAINCDPDSQLAQDRGAERYRGVTFPWAAYANRRHDRKAVDGWSWSGPLGTARGYHDDIRDPFGYAREQVLSSTLFRFYQAIDGDALTPLGAIDFVRRRAAAEYATYLIVYAMNSLGPAVAVPALDADAFADALMQADIGTGVLATSKQVAVAPMGRVGGTAHKVIRWAFEKQGLYTIPGAPPRADGSGDPPPIDVYIEDGRHGEYPYTADWLADPGAVWNRHQPDGITAGGNVNQPPIAGSDNYVYARVNNRGAQPAVDAKVKVFVTAESPIWDPTDPTLWVPLPLMPGGVGQGAVAGGGSTVFGPYIWQPAAPGSFELLSVVDATGDFSNINPASGAPCALLQGLIEYLVPLDNNLGLSEWAVV